MTKMENERNVTNIFILPEFFIKLNSTNNINIVTLVNVQRGDLKQHISIYEQQIE